MEVTKRFVAANWRLPQMSGIFSEDILEAVFKADKTLSHMRHSFVGWSGV
jgi:hypothetical protein